MEKNWDYLNESLVGIIAPAGYGKTGGSVLARLPRLPGAAG